MSRPGREERRTALIRQLFDVGRRQSDATVLYHTALAEGLGLGASEWKTLSLLERAGSLTAGEIAERSGLAPASVTGILDRLESAGWIHRSRDEKDRRRVVVRLDTKVTADRFSVLLDGLQRRLGEVYQKYDEEQLALILEVLERLAVAQEAATSELQEDAMGERRS